MAVIFEKNTIPVTNEGECHVAAVLLVDTSGSMCGNPIEELNRGLVEFGQALKSDALALGRTDVCIISFDSEVKTVMPFCPAANYVAPTLDTGLFTALNEGIEVALDAIEARKSEYKANGVKYYRPWLFCLTDGGPTDNSREATAKARLQKAIADQKVTYIPMGIGESANIQKLQSYYPDTASAKPVLKADQNSFKEAFKWLSASLVSVTHSDPRTTSTIQTPPLPSSLTLGI